MDKQQKLYYRLTGLAVILAIIVVLLGGWTRLNYAGLACPDWPRCFGELVLPGDAFRLEQIQSRYPMTPINYYKSWLEMTHRYLAGLLGLLIITLGYMRLKQPRLRTVLGKVPYIVVGIVIVQGLFGMWTVTLKLLPQVVTMHLLGGMTTLSLLVVMYLKQCRELTKNCEVPVCSKIAKRWVAIGFLILVVQLALGGWTSANYAGWSCEGWLLCSTDSAVKLDFAGGFTMSYIPGENYEGGILEQGARAAIQMSHRTVAVILLVYLSLMAWRWRKENSRVLIAMSCVLCAALIQAGLGLMNVIWAVPLSLATAHHGGAIFLLLTMLWLYWTVSYQVKGDVYESTKP